jgi:hypothetical protein
MQRRKFLRGLVGGAALLPAAAPSPASADTGQATVAPPWDDAVCKIGSRRELFIDTDLLSSMNGTELRLAEPIDAGKVIGFDAPWEGEFVNFLSVLFDGSVYRLYYRGKSQRGKDGTPDEVTCYAESRNGIEWTKPDLGLFEVQGTRRNNVILDKTYQPAPHNFAPFLDTRPGVPAAERYLQQPRSAGLYIARRDSLGAAPIRAGYRSIRVRGEIY